MGEIPNWLIELAEDAENDDNEDADDVTNDIEYPDQTEDAQETEELTEQYAGSQASSGFLEEPVALMDELRSQVDPQRDEMVPVKTGTEESVKPVSFLGMLPWQIAILSVFLFLDIAVIGLLFLAMLGRISIP